MNELKNYTGWIKLALLLIGLPLGVYALSIRQTVSLWGTATGLEASIAQARTEHAAQPDTSPPQIPKSSVELKNGEILHRLTAPMKEYQITAEQYTPFLIGQESGTELYAGELTLAGEFIPLTELLYWMEFKLAKGQIVSVEYRSAEHPQSRKRNLRLTLILQQITSNEAL